MIRLKNIWICCNNYICISSSRKHICGMDGLRKALLLFWCIVILYFGVYIINHNITFNPTISEPRGYYFTYRSTNYNVGGLVLVCIKSGRYVDILQQFKVPVTRGECQNHSPYLLKRIVAREGDWVDITSEGVYVNKKLQMNSRALVAYKNIKLFPVGERRFKLGINQFWLLGNTSHSYDSRYFGVVNGTQLQKKAVLLWQRSTPVW